MSDYDFNKVGGKIFPEGVYDVMVTDILRKPTNSDFLQRIVTLELTDPVGVPPVIKDYISESEKVLWKIQRLFKACGVESEGKVTMSDDWKELLGKEFQIQVTTREYKGKKLNNIEYLPIKSPEEIVDADELAEQPKKKNAPKKKKK